VKAKRHLPAHEAQVLELAQFIDARRNAENPVILGGDFNMRGSQSRFSFFEGRQPLSLVQRYCIERREDCDVRVSWNDDTPWMDTQDLQLFNSGARVKIRPVRVESLFDGRSSGPKLSDHDGLRVIYELSWSLGAPLQGDVAVSGEAGPALDPGLTHRLPPQSL
jgi:endonuclease/exonuclease/phosphatase family metal-dependent hydrolase